MTEANFGTMAELLHRLGFVRRDVPGVRVLFELPDSDYWFVFRPHRDDEPVEPVGLMAMRSQLDAWGILDRDEFDRQIRQLSLAG